MGWHPHVNALAFRAVGTDTVAGYPNPVRYYGRYSNVARKQRTASAGEPEQGLGTLSPPDAGPDAPERCRLRRGVKGSWLSEASRSPSAPKGIPYPSLIWTLL